jgi:biopolymer transport protein ExbD
MLPEMRLLFVVAFAGALGACGPDGCGHKAQIHADVDAAPDAAKLDALEIEIREEAGDAVWIERTKTLLDDEGPSSPLRALREKSGGRAPDVAIVGPATLRWGRAIALLDRLKMAGVLGKFLFVVRGTGAPLRTAKMELPRAKAGDPFATSMVSVTIGLPDFVAVNAVTLATPADLAAALKSQPADAAVVIQGDTAARFDRVVTAIKIAQDLGHGVQLAVSAPPR